MAIHDREFVQVEWEVLLECIRWCCNKLQLRDWEIELIEGYDEAEDSLGSIDISDGDKWCQKAKMWINLDLCQKLNVNPVVVICHEMIHVLMDGKCFLTSEFDEYIPRVFEDLVYEAFCRDNRIKMSRMK